MAQTPELAAMEHPAASTWAETIKEPRVDLRAYNPETDQALLLDSWGRQVRKQEPCRRMNKEEFSRHLDLIQALVERCAPIVASEPGHPEQVFGYVVGEHQGDLAVLHMVYVRAGPAGVWRRLGIGSVLLKAQFPKLGKVPLYHTHWTAGARHHRDRWLLRFNPYLVR